MSLVTIYLLTSLLRSETQIKVMSKMPLILNFWQFLPNNSSKTPSLKLLLNLEKLKAGAIPIANFMSIYTLFIN